MSNMQHSAAMKRLQSFKGQLVKIPSVGIVVLIDVRLQYPAQQGIKLTDLNYPKVPSQYKQANIPWFWIHAIHETGLQWFFIPGKAVQKIKLGPTKDTL